MWDFLRAALVFLSILYSILNWMTVLFEHRLFRISNPVAGKAMRYLRENFSVNVMEERRKLRIVETNLKRIRIAYGCSQSELARMSGVSLRSIQMYEQRNKDINKGQLQTIVQLARTLGCRPEDLMECN